MPSLARLKTPPLATKFGYWTPLLLCPGLLWLMASAVTVHGPDRAAMPRAGLVASILLHCGCQHSPLLHPGLQQLLAFSTTWPTAVARLKLWLAVPTTELEQLPKHILCAGAENAILFWGGPDPLRFYFGVAPI